MPGAPDAITAANIIGRMLAGIGFRFYWATDGLIDQTYAFRSSEEARSIGETVEHIWDLLHWLYHAIDAAGMTKPGQAKQLREATLELIAALEDAFSKMDNDELAAIELLKRPFWPLLDGPLSDVLTHIGQIATLRRMAGFPVAASNPFQGTPPPGR